MGRKQAGEVGKKEEILAAAQQLFLEKGFDGTSVRAVMKQAGGEIGLFYYYFKNKDDAFEHVLDRFFANYEADFARIISEGRRNPCRLMETFFEYVETGTEKFRDRYAKNMHRTVRWAIREHTMEIILPYLRQIVEIQSDYYGVAPAIEPDAAAAYLTYGVCSTILHEKKENYFEIRRGIKQGVSLIMAMPANEQELRIPYPATEADIPAWMRLLDRVEGCFPGLNKQEFEGRLALSIASGEVFVVRNGYELAGGLIYSKQRSEIGFLAVDPDFCRRGIAGRLVETAAAQLPVGAELSVVTFRDGDAAGEVALGFYKSLGFKPVKEIVMFDYPLQILSVTVPNAPLNYDSKLEKVIK